MTTNPPTEPREIVSKSKEGLPTCPKCGDILPMFDKHECDYVTNPPTGPRETGRNDWNDVEIFLRLYGRLPHSEDREKLDYKKYCDMVMQGKKCPRGKLYDIDGLWEYAWGMYKKTTKETT